MTRAEWHALGLAFCLMLYSVALGLLVVVLVLEGGK